MTEIERPVRHVPVEDRPEVKSFASQLKDLFDSVGMTLGMFSKTNPIDKPSLSRYLNGKRVPRDRWLLDRLFALRVEAGTPLTDQARTTWSNSSSPHSRSPTPTTTGSGR